MAKFNKPVPATNVVQTSKISTTTHEGGTGFSRDAKSELFLLGIQNFVSEKTFYESADSRDKRFENLLHQVAIEDVEWLHSFIRWLRNDANMRSASVVAAAEAVKARLAAGISGGNRGLIDVALGRADEPGELLGYWLSRYGKKLPMPVKRGIADAVLRLYNEYSYIKYNPDKGIRFSDVLQLTHPKSLTTWQNNLFKQILRDRYDQEDTGVSAFLPILTKNKWLKQVPVSSRRALLTPNIEGGSIFENSGFTWEQVSGWIQSPMTADVWEAIIPHMGYMALLRNLRNFEQAGISSESVDYVKNFLSDPDKVARSRQFPFRFVSARNAVTGYKFLDALETALELSLSNIPEIKGNTLILVDRSASMFGRTTARSTMSWATMAAVFGMALSRRCEKADLIEFGTQSQHVPFNKHTPILEGVKRFHSMGGTETSNAVHRWYKGHDRVIILTDEQAYYSYRGTPGDIIPKNIPLYTWNFVGYNAAHAAGDLNRFTVGGLTDASFKMIQMLERHRNGKWPWEN